MKTNYEVNSAGKTKIKVSIKALASELFATCNPRMKDVGIHIHYFDFDSVSVVATGIPDYRHELVVDVNELKSALKLCEDILDQRENYKKRKILERFELVDGEVRPKHDKEIQLFTPKKDYINDGTFNEWLDKHEVEVTTESLQQWYAAFLKTQ